MNVQYNNKKNKFKFISMLRMLKRKNKNHDNKLVFFIIILFMKNIN